MWTRCGSRISPRPPEVCPDHPLSSTSSASGRAAAARRDPRGEPARHWCWGARNGLSWSRPSGVSSTTSTCNGAAAGEEPSFSNRATSCGSTPGYPGTTPCGRSDVVAAAEWVGDLVGRGAGGLRVGPVSRCTPVAPEPGEFGELVCFAGRGPGEVLLFGSQGGRTLTVAEPRRGVVLLLRVHQVGSPGRWSICSTWTKASVRTSLVGSRPAPSGVARARYRRSTKSGALPRLALRARFRRWRRVGRLGAT